MKLYPKDYTAAVEVAKATVTAPGVVDEVKAIVKAYVTTPRDYCQIVKHIEAERGLSGIVDVIAIIDMVKNEWHPVVVEAEPKTVEK